MEISTSILSVKKENAIQTFYNLEIAKTDYFHIDVMDGKFVAQDTSNLMLEYAQTIKHISNIPLDIHLMVENVENYLNEYLSLMPAYITIHYESFKNKTKLEETIRKIKQEGVKVGISIKPSTKVEEIKNYLHYLNLALVMTVEPGYGGQKFIEEMLPKIQELKLYSEKEELDYYIEVDGGINLDTIQKVRECGCDIAVVGSAIINSEDKKKMIQDLKSYKV